MGRVTGQGDVPTLNRVRGQGDVPTLNRVRVQGDVPTLNRVRGQGDVPTLNTTAETSSECNGPLMTPTELGAVVLGRTLIFTLLLLLCDCLLYKPPACDKYN